MSSDRHLSRQIPQRNGTPRASGASEEMLRNLKSLSVKSDSLDDDDGITVGFVTRSLARWWPWALPVTLVMAAAGGAVVLALFEPVYEAVALIEIKDEPDYIVQPLQAETQGERFVFTQFELLRGPLVLSSVVENPDVAKLPEIKQAGDKVSYLSGRIVSTSVGNSELYEVSCQGQTAESAALLTNAIVDEYFKLREKSDNSRMQNVIDLLEEEKQRRLKVVAELREKVKELGKKVLGRDPFAVDPTIAQTAGNDAIQEVENIQRQLTDVEVEGDILELQIATLEAMEADQNTGVPAFMIDMAVENHPEVQRYVAQLHNKKTILQQTEGASILGRDTPSYRRLEREIKALEQSQDEVRQSVRPSVARSLASNTLHERKTKLTELKSQLETLRFKQSTLEARYKEELAQLTESGGESLDFAFARAELVREQEVFDTISERSLGLKTELRAPERVTLRKRATAPSAPMERWPKKKLLMVLLASIAGPFGLALVWELVVQRISDAQQLESTARVAVVGEIAKLPLWDSSPYGESATKYGDLVEESIDSLRTCLVLADDDEDIQILAITSAVSGEGKSSVSSQLAASIARSSDQKTLLIDADLRVPDIHHIFKLDLEPGLCSVLDATCRCEDAIVTNWSKNLDILPAGQLEMSPHKLVNKKILRPLFEKLRAEYRFIIIDTPPILPASEALTLAREADGVLISAMRDTSRGRQVRMAHRRLMATGAKVIGAVLNGVPQRNYTARYGYYAPSREV